MADINLLPVEEREQERVAGLGKKLSVVSVIILAITAVFTLVTLLFFTTMVSKRNQLIAKVSSDSGQIESFKDIEELLVVVKSKAGVADEILAGRQDHSQILLKLSELVPQNVYFSDIRFAAQKISLSGKAKTSTDLAGLVSSFTSPAGAELISNVTIDSLGSDQSGVYQFSMTILMVK